MAFHVFLRSAGLCLALSVQGFTAPMRAALGGVESRTLDGTTKGLYADRLHYALQENAAFSLQEREKLDALLGEQALQQSGLCADSICMEQASRLLGVSHLLFASVEKTRGSYMLAIRLVEVSSGKVVATAISECACEEEMALQVLPRSVAGKLREGLAGGAIASPAKEKALVLLQERAGMRLLPAGSFLMGGSDSDAERDELPVREVAVKAFWMDVTEVTQEAYAQLMERNPSHFNGCPLCPVEKVSWKEADLYCRQAGKRLPSEAEWEYAARAGSESAYAWGDEPDARFAWSDRNAENHTHPVATTEPNAWGLRDMSGNVREWVGEWYSPGRERVVRGGSFYYPPRSGRSATREGLPPPSLAKDLGFRCAQD